MRPNYEQRRRLFSLMGENMLYTLFSISKLWWTTIPNNLLLRSNYYIHTQQTRFFPSKEFNIYKYTPDNNFSDYFRRITGVQVQFHVLG